MKENKQEICNKMCEALKLTSALGNPINNPLVELRYMADGNGIYSEVVRPILADGTGKDGWYDINVSCDSGLGVVIDIVNQFVRRM